MEQRRIDTINAAISEHANAQEGLISGAQLVAAGMSARSVSQRLRSGALTRRSLPAKPKPTRSPSGRATHRRVSPLDVFGTHAGPLDLNARRWLALLSTPEPRWLSSVTIFALLGLERPTNEPIHVLRSGGGWNAPRGVVAHRTTVFDQRDARLYGRFPGVVLSRALVEAANGRGRLHVPDERLDDVVDTAVRLKVYDATDMLRALADRQTIRGARRMEEVVGRLDATSGTFRSNFERRTKWLIARSNRLPEPAVNVLVHGFESDLWFPGTRAIIECDGRDYHRSPAQIAKDEEREAILRARGFVFLRLRWHHVKYEEEVTLARIERFVLANLDAPQPLAA